jgi:hypothetical protein
MTAIARGEIFAHTVPQDIAPELLIEPSVINGLAHDIAVSNAEHIGDFWLTPAVEVNTSVEGGRELVTLGRPYTDGTEYPRRFPDYSVYVTDPQRETLSPWFIFPDMVAGGVLDGQSQPIVDAERLQFVRDTLTSIDQVLIDRALSAASAPAFELRRSYLESMDQEIGRIATRLTELQALREDVADGGVLELVTHIKDDWERDGGKSTDTKSYVMDQLGSQLPQVIEQAIDEFEGKPAQ